MEKITNEPFTEHDFVAILLQLLCQNGVYKINESELEKKLGCYYKNPNFRELFQRIYMIGSINGEKVCLYEGLYQEKYFTNNIRFEQRHSDILYLVYDKNRDLSRYEKHLSEDGKAKIRLIAKQLGLIYKLECDSKYKVNIYGYNPNCDYILVEGENWSRTLSFELITDGDIETIEYGDIKNEKIYYESPLNIDEAVQLRDKKVIYVGLKNASFAIKQGLCNGEIRYCNINTEITNEEKLKQIVNIANREYVGGQYALIEEAPYVRKLVLK